MLRPPSRLGQHVENLSLTGYSNIAGTGNGLANVIKGNDGDNRLSGHGGNDSLHGGKGDDLLTGGKGNDYLVGGSGHDTFVFEKGGGRDQIHDFQNGVDKIDVSSFGLGAHLTLSQVGHDVQVRIGHDVLVLEDVSIKHIDHDRLHLLTLTGAPVIGGPVDCRPPTSNILGCRVPRSIRRHARSLPTPASQRAVLVPERLHRRGRAQWPDQHPLPLPDRST